MPSPVTGTIINLIDSGTVPFEDLADIEQAISAKRAKEMLPLGVAPAGLANAAGPFGGSTLTGSFKFGDKVRMVKVTPKYLQGMIGVLVPMPTYPRTGGRQRLAMFVEALEINRFGGHNKIGKFLRPMPNGNGHYISVTHTMIEVVP
jgi:hypothetical protein